MSRTTKHGRRCRYESRESSLIVSFVTLATFTAVATLAALLALPRVAGAQTADTVARPIRLADAIGAAQRNSPQALQAHGQISTAVIEERAAYAAFLPNVAVGLNTNYANTLGNSGTAPATVVSQTGAVVGGSGRSNFNSSSAVTASLTLFDGGQRIYDVRAARADLASAKAASLGQEYATALSVSQAFFDAEAAREALVAAQTQLALADSAARIAYLKTHLREATLSDSLRAAISVADGRLAIETAVTNLATANAQLSRLVASPVSVTADPADSGASMLTLPDTATLIALATSGPSVAQAAAQEAAAAAQQRSARAAYFPQVDATYSFSGNGQNAYVIGNQIYGNRLGLSFSLPILDQYQREQAFARAEVAAANAGASAKDARLAARATLVQSTGQMLLAERRIAEQTLSIRAAQEDLRIQLDRYRIGESTIVDVLTSESELTTAQSALIQARLDYRVARAQIEALIGRPL
ncbi:MAG TPA: TolC family protein [Gemmatimonadaceae bacterium]|nr:TolC family protein [Gemmatimonadaceae bacterium]